MKVQNLLIIVMMALWGLSANAQITFQKTYGGTGADMGFSVMQTRDSGYIIVGSTYSFGADSVDVYLIKTNIFGDTVFTKTFGGHGDNEGLSVQQTIDGGYVITGYTNSIGNNSAENNVYLIRTDSLGDTLFTRTFGGPTSDNRGYSIQQTSDGGLIICGYKQKINYGDWDVYLIKTTIYGDTLWTKTIGGTDNDYGLSSQQTSDGGFIIVGESTTFSLTSGDYYLIKTDSVGEVLWSKIIYNQPDIDTYVYYGQSVVETSDGGYVFTGTLQNTNAVDTEAISLIKINSIGGIIWTKTFGYGMDGSSYAYSVQQTLDGGFIITGYNNSISNAGLCLIKTDSIGDTLWTRTFGGTNDWGTSVKQTIDGGYIITGITYEYGSGNGDVYLIKTDSNGNSGCNQSNSGIHTMSYQFIDTNFISNVSLGSVIINAVTLVGNGSIITNLCQNSFEGLLEISKNNYGVLIYPNPASTLLNIHQSTPSPNQQLIITDLVGTEVYKEILTGIDNTISISAWSEGIYFYQITTSPAQSGETYRGKFIKEN